MFYYRFNIGDYIKQTAYLEPMADLAYRRMLDLYFDSEAPFPNQTQWVAERIRMPKELKIVQKVLSEFFELDTVDNCWHHRKADEQIQKYQANAAKNRANGAKSKGPKKYQKTANPGGSQSVPNQEPNIKKSTRRKKPAPPVDNLPDDDNPENSTFFGFEDEMRGIALDEFQWTPEKYGRVMRKFVDFYGTKTPRGGWVSHWRRWCDRERDFKVIQGRAARSVDHPSHRPFGNRKDSYQWTGMPPAVQAQIAQALGRMRC